jgi:hypothetical protein
MIPRGFTLQCFESDSPFLLRWEGKVAACLKTWTSFAKVLNGIGFHMLSCGLKKEIEQVSETLRSEKTGTMGKVQNIVNIILDVLF